MVEGKRRKKAENDDNIVLTYDFLRNEMMYFTEENDN